MTTRPAAEIAWEAADLITTLAYATMPHEDYPGLQEPADVYNVAGALETLSRAGEQVLSQLRKYMSDQHEAGRIAHDGGTNPQGDVLAVVWALGRAWDAQSKATDWLSVAHNRSRSLKPAEPAP